MLHRFGIHSAFELLLISRMALLGCRIARRKATDRIGLHSLPLFIDLRRINEIIIIF